jgi:hypothetical protein
MVLEHASKLVTSNTATALDRTSAVVDSQLTLRVGYGRDKRKAARRAALISHAVVAGYTAVDRHLVLILLLAIRQEADASEPDNHRRPCGRLGDGRNGELAANRPA